MSNDTQNRISNIFEEYFSSSELDKETICQFQQWLMEEGHDEEKEQAFEQLCNKYITFDATPSKSVMRSYEKNRRRLKKDSEIDVEQTLAPTTKIGLRRRIGYIAVAAMIPIMLLVGSVFLLMTKSTDAADQIAEIGPHEIENKITVPSDGKKYAKLPDNSTIWINGDSELSYASDFAENRMVKLRGEAFFDVAKGEENPFSIKIGGITATVLGTVFNIQEEEGLGLTRISLYEGRLKVDLPESTFYMEAGEEITYDQNKNIIERTITSKSEPDWLRNIINFEKKPVKEIFESIEKIYSVKINYKNAKIDRDTISFKFEGGIGLDDAMFLMSQLSQFDYSIKDDSVDIFSIIP